MSTFRKISRLPRAHFKFNVVRGASGAGQQNGVMMSCWSWGTKMQEELDQSLQVDVLSAALRMNSGETGDLLEFLAQKLSQALPNQTEVERGGWMLSSKKPVNKITVRFEERHFEIARERTGCSARIMKAVRGVVLKTTDVGVDEWTKEVAQELFKVAEHNAKAKEALKRFVIG